MKRCLILLFVREIQMKITMKYTKLPVEWLRFKLLMVASADKNTEPLKLSFVSGVNAKWYNHFGKLTFKGNLLVVPWLGESYFPDEELSLLSLHWKHRVLTTEPPGKSLKSWQFL